MRDVQVKLTWETTETIQVPDDVDDFHITSDYITPLLDNWDWTSQNAELVDWEKA